MKANANMVDEVAAAIATTFPLERPELRQFYAESLCAQCEWEGLPVTSVLLWLRDEPPPRELSSAAWRKFCARYKFRPARELEPAHQRATPHRDRRVQSILRGLTGAKPW